MTAAGEDSLESHFRAAAAFAARRRELSDGAKLRLYAWYKLATVGPCAAPRPGLLDVVGRAKWHAWKAQSAGSPSVEDSKRRYIATLNELTGWHPSAADDAAGKAEGPEPSSSSSEEEEEEEEGEEEEEVHWSENEEDDAEFLRRKVRPSSSGEAAGGISLVAVSTLGADCSGRDQEDLPEGRTEEERALFRCAKSGDGIAEVLAAIRQKPALARVTDKLGMTPLHWAADRGNFALVKGLVETARADVNARDQEGETCLHLAAAAGHADVVEYLLRNGASPSARDADGSLPADLAASADVRRLVE